MSMSRVRLGRQGESLARQYLQQAGYRILAANYRCPWGEVDLVAQEGEELVFVEVRTRRSSAYGSPQESITAEKIERLQATAQDYLQNHTPEPGRSELHWRIDLVSIRFDGAGASAPSIEHLKHAVQF